MNDHYDIILVGSGVGALTAASLMAQLRDKRVLVLEKHNRPGGYTHDFKRGRRYFKDAKKAGAGLTFYTRALVNFATTPSDRPVVKGVYRFSRHPIQLLGIVMWIGVGIAATSWVILLVCVIQLFLSRPFLIAQERFCLDTYGEPYKEYMQKTPRYFW